MKLFSFIKTLFSRKSTETVEVVNYVPTHDVFGDEIRAHDYLVPVEYVDVRRRGYLTIKQDFALYRPVELKNINIEKVMRLSTLESYMNTEQVSNSRRHGFMHVHCKMQAFK
jgi:hypothetical protein